MALTAAVEVAAAAGVPDDADAVGVLVGVDGPVPELGFDRAAVASGRCSRTSRWASVPDRLSA